MTLRVGDKIKGLGWTITRFVDDGRFAVVGEATFALEDIKLIAEKFGLEEPQAVEFEARVAQNGRYLEPGFADSSILSPFSGKRVKVRVECAE